VPLASGVLQNKTEIAVEQTILDDVKRRWLKYCQNKHGVSAPSKASSEL